VIARKLSILEVPFRFIPPKVDRTSFAVEQRFRGVTRSDQTETDLLLDKAEVATRDAMGLRPLFFLSPGPRPRLPGTRHVHENARTGSVNCCRPVQRRKRERREGPLRSPRPPVRLRHRRPNTGPRRFRAMRRRTTDRS
jgi:hypothetical protein